MTKIERRGFAIALAVLAAIGFLMFGVPAVKAAPSFFISSNATNNAATSTPAYLTVGTAATSTVTWQITTGTLQAADSASLLTQFVGSSTSAVLTISLEYSQNGVDWYKDDLFNPVVSTTSSSVSLTAANSYTWTYAAVNVGGATTTQANSPKIITVPTPLAYVRAVYTIAGANGSVWGQFIGKRQTSGN